MKDKITVGCMVKWVDSTYIVLEIKGDGAILKQNFSIGTVLISPVPLKDLRLLK